MAYQALYRAYRPQTFSNVVGQETIVKTLQNAIINKKITHAYLFCGPRGTGKTSVARIFAKALNCSNVTSTGEPCCECISCKEISESISPDVIEIDAASNNGVDEIRDIRERVKFLPSGAKYKIYIIDEVHMLSTGAFNALLKILEEPPAHVVFILATTEPQKLPSTIISRCQRYEFKPIAIDEMGKNIKAICDKEGVTITDDAIELIGEVADGGMRDALSILDQTISYGSKEIGVDDVNTITGSINAETMCNLMSSIDSRDASNALDLINNLIKEGKEVSKIVNGMLLFCRDLMLYKSVGDSQVNKYIFEKEKFKELAIKISNTKIIYFIEILCDIQGKVKYSNSPAIYLEIAIIRMSEINNEELDVIKRMNELETKILDNTFGGETEITPNNIDNEKVNSIDNRLNQVVTELSKLQLPELSKKVNEIDKTVKEKINIDELNSSQTVSANSKILELESEITSKFVDIEAKIASIENGKPISFDNDESKENSYDSEEIESIKKDLDKIKKSIDEIKVNDKPSYDDSALKEEISSLKESIDGISKPSLFNDNSNSQIQYNNYDDSEIKSDIETLKEAIIELQTNIENSSASSNNDVDTQKYIETLKLYENRLIALENNNSKDIGDNISEVDNSGLIEEFNNKYEELNKKINEIENQKQSEKSLDLNETVSLVMFKELEVKYNQLEKQLLELTAEKLSPKAKPEKASKPDKTAKGQMTIFDIIADEAKTDLDSDFGDLNKSEEEINIEEENEKVVEEIKDNDIDFRTEEIAEPVKQVKEETQEIKVGLFDDVKEETESVSEEKETTSTSYEDIDFKPEIKPEPVETVVEEKVIEKAIESPKEEFVENVVKNETKATETYADESEGRDKFAKYDIKDLEKIMRDALEISAKNDKKRIVEIWNNLLKGADPTMYSIAELLSEGKIEAVGNREIVITFESKVKSSEVMKWTFKNEALRFLYSRLGDSYNYLALPVDVWKEKRSEYVDQYQMGIKDVKLTPFDRNKIILTVTDTKSDEEKNKTISETIDLFGDGIVKIK